MLVTAYKTTRRHNPEGLSAHRAYNLYPKFVIYFSILGTKILVLAYT
jgi:hypothetical protein